MSQPRRNWEEILLTSSEKQSEINN